MYMVCILHTLGQGGVLGSVKRGTVQYCIYWFMEIIAFCAVDGFAIISGYTATDKPQKYSKIADMWFQAFFYSFVVTAIFAWLKFDTVTPIDSETLKRYILPLSSNAFWFFTAYFVLFFAEPWLYRGISAMPNDTATIALLLIIGPFAWLETTTGVFRTSSGYSAAWLMIAFCVGVLAKKVGFGNGRKIRTLILMLFGCSVITWLNFVFGGKLVSYTSPTVLFSGLLLVLIFERLSPNKKAVGFLSPMAFGIYLFQNNYGIWNNWLKGTCTFIAKMELLPGIGTVLLIALCIFCSGLIVEWIRSRIAILMRLSDFNNLIVKKIELILKKLVCKMQDRGKICGRKQDDTY